jgi:polar amino acid transport system substrate-binding protein
MKNTRTGIKATLATLLLGAASFSVQAADPIKLCHDEAESAPWIIKDGKGLNIVLLEMAAAKAGVKLDIAVLPWKRCLGEVESGAIAGAIAASYKEERAKFAMYPSVGDKPDPARRLYTDSYTLYRATGNKLAWDGSKFAELTGSIGAQRGYSINDDLKKWGAKVDEGSGHAKDNFKKLVGGQVQGVALNTLQGDLISASSEFKGKVEKVSPPLIEKPYYVIFGKDFYSKNQKAVDGFWDVLAKTRDSKEYKAKEAAVLKK